MQTPIKLFTTNPQKDFIHLQTDRCHTKVIKDFKDHDQQRHMCPGKLLLIRLSYICRTTKLSSCINIMSLYG